MTPEQLLIKRIKIIAELPFKPAAGMYNIGDILTDNGKTEVLDQNDNAVFPCEWEKYPYVFQILEWWEDRKIEDMPGYVKLEGYVDSFNNPVKTIVLKVKKHFSASSGNWRDDSFKIFVPEDDSKKTLNYSMYVPATEAEYLEYIKTKA